MARWMEGISGLPAAFAFFSRFPLPQFLQPSGEEATDLHRCVIWFPIAGLLVAAVPAVVFWSVSQIAAPAIAAGLAICVYVIATGALHEDGLADCADGLGGAGDRDQALKIMRDSQAGTYGAAALIFSIGLRWVALSALPPLAGLSALLIAGAAARGSIATALAFSNYARPAGKAKIVSERIAISDWAITLVVSLLLGALAGGLSGLFCAAVGIAAAACFLIYFRARIGGYTGDALGAMEQIAEIAILLSLAVLWGWS